ncbi:MAG TPA: 50S ribosomal protein L11 methyltransferase [Blastocatellia bacterium]|nr:50S ribosomal protein L11 methyltransferase [Blastocatellia bacterium]
MIDPEILSFHLMLLNDRGRMTAYRRAIFETVQPGDVVLDVGTGSGILAIFACQAGAKRVYAIDRGEIIVLARELARANGLADRITFLKKDVKRLKLEEPVDVVTSELIAKAVLGQNMAELIGFCRDRFLKPAGKILPERVELHIAPVQNEIGYQQSRPPERNLYEIRFDPLQQLSINKPISSRIAAEALLDDGQTAYSYYAATASNSDTFQTKLTFLPKRKGMLHGFAGWFSAVLAKGIALTNEPPGTPSWDNLFFPLSESVEVEPGMSVEVDLRGRCDSQVQEFWIWNTTVRKADHLIASHKQSSFAGRILSMDAIRKASEGWRPAPNLNAKIAQLALGLMDQNASLRTIADRVQKEFPDNFVTVEDALIEVRKIAEQYGD